MKLKLTFKNLLVCCFLFFTFIVNADNITILGDIANNVSLPTHIVVVDSAGYNYTECIFADNGKFNECGNPVQSNFEGGGYIAKFDSYIYITLPSQNAYEKCKLDQNDKIKNCQIEQVSIANQNPLNTPLGIKYSNGYAYILNQGEVHSDGTYTGSGIVICKVDENTHDLNHCSVQNPNNSLSGPIGILINGKDVYITNNQPNSDNLQTITICEINSDTGLLTNCTVKTDNIALVNPSGITENNKHIYILDGILYPRGEYTRYTKCDISNDGASLKNCATNKLAVGNFGFSGQGGGDIAIRGEYAYITSSSDSSYVMCKVDSTNNGNLKNCNSYSAGNISFGSTLQSPSGVLFY